MKCKTPDWIKEVPPGVLKQEEEKRKQEEERRDEERRRLPLYEDDLPPDEPSPKDNDEQGDRGATTTVWDMKDN